MVGATVIESPVWIPIGSIFSIEQIITTLSFLSLNNSSSYSFQPSKALSINTSWIGDASNPLVSNSSKFSELWTKEAPVPPRVNEGLITNGNPKFWAISFPFKKEFAVSAGATGISIFLRSSLNLCLSSVMLIASMSTPIISTLKSSQIPFSSASIHKFKAVWPPIVGSTASILLSDKISIIDLVFKGFKNIWSAMVGSVIIVAGLELIK